jgi:hypothetical protein
MSRRPPPIRKSIIPKSNKIPYVKPKQVPISLYSAPSCGEETVQIAVNYLSLLPRDIRRELLPYAQIYYNMRLCELIEFTKICNDDRTWKLLYTLELSDSLDPNITDWKGEYISRQVQYNQQPFKNKLEYAAKYGLDKKVRGLLAAGVDIHTQNDVALVSAIRHNHLSLVKYLLEPRLGPNGKIRQANVHALNDEALRVATESVNIDMVNLLLQYGANPTRGLIAAAAENNYDLVKYFISSGGDINVLTTDQRERLIH